MNQDDEFYIGYLPNAPKRTGSFTRMAVGLLLLVGIGVGGTLAFFQSAIGVSRFEFGNKRTFEGVLQKSPYPHLVVTRPGESGDAAGVSRYYLVQPFKFGLSDEICGEFDGRSVSFEGTLAYRDHQTLIEANPSSFQLDADATAVDLSEGESLGRYTLRGEIVDSKCYLGVMNPGNLKTHRACAVRCIAGGIAPLLIVQEEGQPPLYLLLASAEGEPVNDRVLSMVAEPLEITGEIVRYDDMLVLKADPGHYERVF